MYILKNACRSVLRARGRNILIGIIGFVIAVSACIALSIRESAEKAKEDTLASMTVTAQISLDRQSMMERFRGENSEFDREQMKENLQSNEQLTLEDYLKYAECDSVNSFYYTLSSSLNAVGDLEPIDSNDNFTPPDSENGSEFSGMPQMPGGKDGNFGKMGQQGDFTVIGYSSDEAMSDFASKTSYITDGAVFDEGTEKADCIISEELATYNSIAVGDTLTLSNPNRESEEFAFTVVGIYATENSEVSGFDTASDSANRIYTSYAALSLLCEASEASAEESEDDSASAISGMLSASYTFESVEDYESFEAEARAAGLDDSYTVSSNDITAFEQSLTPLENLSEMSRWFLLVVFAIGAVILVVLNIFSIRERKYEIGVLTAIGMKKSRVALQFITELFIVMLCAIIIGAGVGAASSVPVTNALLSAQIEANQTTAEGAQQSFNREVNGMGGGLGMPPSDFSGQKPDDIPDNIGGKGGFMAQMMSGAADYIDEVSYSTNLEVVYQLILVGLALTVISGLAAMLFIMRYDPLRILSNRD